MNIFIPFSWLEDYLDTDATPSEIAKYLSLCGPSVDRTEKKGNDFVFDVEITTNRVDAMSILGIAREASAILPRFGKKAKLHRINKTNIANNTLLDIQIKNDPELCNRILAVKLENIKIGRSPDLIRRRLEMVGQRALNSAIDITNYVMWEAGHPIHVFDYDKIKEKKIIVREAKKGESLITLDDKKHTLKGGEVVFDNGKGEIIDLPGIMGTKNSSVDEKTKNVLLWVESIDPTKIRQASIGLNIRSQAAILNEKSVDHNLGEDAILRAVKLYKEICGAKPGSKLVDINPNPYKGKSVTTSIDHIESILGIKLEKGSVTSYLKALGFEVKWKGNEIAASVPSHRANDISIPEDIVEEVARIHGYSRLPGKIMEGQIPQKPELDIFDFEDKLKSYLFALGGHEIYTMSLVGKDWFENDAVELANPLGEDTKYLRTSLAPSLSAAAKTNSTAEKKLHIFEVANTYHKRKSSLPEEKLTLAGLFVNYNFRNAKGIVESLLEFLNINHQEVVVKNNRWFISDSSVSISSGNTEIGKFGKLKSGFFYYEFEVEKLQKAHNPINKFVVPSKYPPQIEDLTLRIQPGTYIYDVINTIKASHKFVSDCTLHDIYENAYTFRINYHNPKKTLTDKEVKKIRDQIIEKLKKGSGVNIIS